MNNEMTRTGVRAVLITTVLSVLLFPSEMYGQSTTIPVRDLGLVSGFQDTSLGHYKRGRANIAADFDLDGVTDFYIGNPGDESIVLHGILTPPDGVRYELVQVLVPGAIAWSGTSFDYDNDGDYDIFIGCGGNEGVGLDYLFRNNWIPDGQVSGVLSFTDVTSVAGIAGPVPDGEQQPVPTATAGGVAADYDRDGDDDLFVSCNNKPVPNHPELSGRNTLWRNNGNGTFTDVSVASGLGVILGGTRHSTFFDYDNDGFMDLFENNYHEANRLWRNNGDGTFTDVTADLSAHGDDLSYPYASFASAAADFNNDGWEDLMVWMRGTDNPGGDAGGTGLLTGGGSPYEDGHAVFINHGGTAFENVAPATNVNEMYVSDPTLGVMGCQVGDVNGDGIPDVYIGNGGPFEGYGDQLFISDGSSADNPVFANFTFLIDFPAASPQGWDSPPYPYRTHGVSIVDADNDGETEICVVNGGPSGMTDIVREPNRLFDFGFSYNFLALHLVGDGTTVSEDAIGSRVAVTVSNNQRKIWTVRKTLYGGSAFSAHNGFDMNFGLGDANDVLNVSIVWPDGERSILTDGFSVNSRSTIEYHGGNAFLRDAAFRKPSAEAQTGDVVLLSGVQNYPNPFNPGTAIRYSLTGEGRVFVGVYDLLGREVKILKDGFEEAGERLVFWDGTGGDGETVSTGIYFCRIVAGDQTEIHRMMLMK